MYAHFIPAISLALSVAGGDTPAAQVTPQPSIQTPQISLENRALLRCAAAFAILSEQQKLGGAKAGKWPDLGDRGREFFVQALAQIMDQDRLSRTDIARMTGVEAQKINHSDELDRIMPACLAMLENSGI